MAISPFLLGTIAFSCLDYLLMVISTLKAGLPALYFETPGQVRKQAAHFLGISAGGSARLHTPSVFSRPQCIVLID